jgi:hypothetical protein
VSKLVCLAIKPILVIVFCPVSLILENFFFFTVLDCGSTGLQSLIITAKRRYLQPIEQDDKAGGIWNLATLAVLHSNTRASRSESIV